MDSLYEDIFTFMTISRLILLIMGNILGKICRECQNTHFKFNYFFFKTFVLYEIMSRNVKRERPQIQSMRVLCWTSKATRPHAHVHVHASGHTHTHTHKSMHTQVGTKAHTNTDKYVTLIVFPRQQWFRERA
jgi:hypothetical protein